MKVLYWNIRGIANSPSRLALQNLILSHKPDIIFVSEPWISYHNFPHSWFHRLGFKIFSFNSRENLPPNLWCICASNLNPTFLDHDDQQVSFKLNLNNVDFYFSAIYASTSNIKRKLLWQKHTHLQSLHDAPWCFIGDFNAILGAHEHLGSLNPARPPMLDFQLWTDQNNLIHIPTRGAFFTWDNGRDGRRHIKRRLDKTICNHKWLDACTSLSCSTLTRSRSDHYPLLLEFKTDSQQFTPSFKFLKMWSLHKDCKDIISSSWNENVVGNPMTILSSKLKRLKFKLKEWNKNVFGNIHQLVKDAEKELSDIQSQIHNTGHNDQLMVNERQAQLKLDEALLKQEMFWQEKARVRWHLDGDRNSSYFHRLTKIKNKTKMISSLLVNDELTSDPQMISNHIVSYYNRLFSSSNTVLQDQQLVEDVIPKLIDDTTNNLLIMIPSLEEVKKAVFDLNQDSAPGPDGFGAGFCNTPFPK